jgi:hypothetical protein
MVPRPLFLPVGAVLLACSAATEPIAQATGKSVPGNYRYTAMTADGQPILEGTLTLRFAEDTIPDETTDEGGGCCHWTISGTWSIGWMEGADTTLDVGPQVGTGDLRGAILHGEQEGKLALDLSPGWADYNAGLLAVREGDRLTGEWGWSAINGPRTSGPFVAVRY